MAAKTFPSDALAAERTHQGMLLGLTGLAANGLLCVGKCLLGWLSGSAAVLADGFNNLADAASSLVTLLAFQLSAKLPDEAHPYGYGRLEYLCGLIMAVLILLTGLEAARTALVRFWQPEPLLLTSWLIPFLSASIIVKLLLAAYSHRCGRRLTSPAVQAYAADSLIDACTTAFVLFGVLVGAYTSWPLDALVGLAMAGSILAVGVKALRSNLSPLLGQGPDEALKASVTAIVSEVPGLFGWHQLEIHDYGPDKRSLSLHVCCADTLTLTEAHALESLLQSKLAQSLHLEATIHLDPQTLLEGESPDVSRPGRLLKDHLDCPKAAWLRALCGYRRKTLCHQTQCFPSGAPFGIPRTGRFRQPSPHPAHPRRLYPGQ